MTAALNGQGKRLTAGGVGLVTANLLFAILAECGLELGTQVVATGTAFVIVVTNTFLARYFNSKKEKTNGI